MARCRTDKEGWKSHCVERCADPVDLRPADRMDFDKRSLRAGSSCLFFCHSGIILGNKSLALLSNTL